MITIANKKTYRPRPGDVVFYVGRPDILGNPYTHNPVGNTLAKFKTSTREEAIESYRTHFKEVLLNIPEAVDRINHIAREHQAGHNVILLCWCAPEPCHASVIKEYLTSPEIRT